MKNEICKIKEHIAVLSEKNGYTIEVNLVEYIEQKGKEKIDIRRWNRNEDKMLKGISLNIEEAKTLKDALDNYFKDK